MKKIASLFIFAIIILTFCGLIWPDSKSIAIQEKYVYVGMEKCASVCHNNKEMGFQYDIVKASPHAEAYNSLTTPMADRIAKEADLKEKPWESQVCLKCHSTASSLDSSFLAPTYKKEDGVTCEACHKGPFITKTFIPVEKDCLTCHNNSVHRIRRFDFSVSSARIAHHRPGNKNVQLNPTGSED